MVGSAWIVLRNRSTHGKVCALSEYITETGPRLAANFLKASKKERAVISGSNSR